MTVGGQTDGAGGEPRAATRFARWPMRALLGLWAIAALVVSATLMLPHVYALPKPPPSDEVFVGAVRALRRATQPGEPVALHVLYGECRCSNRILEHLVRRRPLAGLREVVALVGPEHALEAQLAAAGYEVQRLTPEQLAARFHVVSAPLLAVMDGTGTLGYVGGYTLAQQGPAIQDREIIEAVSAGRAARALPVLGCAVSAALQRALDPLGLKYR